MKFGNGKQEAPPTLGSVRGPLEKLGYRPMSASRPYGVWGGGPPSYGSQLPAHVISEDPPAVRLGAGLGLLIVNVAQIEDRGLRERALGVLEKRGLLSGPYRQGSDDRRCYPVRTTAERSRSALQNAIELSYFGYLPLDATWPRGTLLDAALAQLPELSQETVEELFSPLGPIERLPFELAEERRPPPKAHKRGWLGESA